MWQLRKAFLLSVVVISSWGPIAGQSANGSSDYALPFGSNPFLPSRALADFAGFLKPSDFPPASYCAPCHSQIHEQWRESAHANAFREPFYQKNVQLLIDDKGIEYSRHCEGCHNPIALFSGALTKSSGVDRSFDNDGITCSVCHSIHKLQDTTGTGSYVMGVPAVMLNPDGTPRRGLPSRDEILGNLDLHKRAVMRDFMRTPEFCAACHKAAIPRELDGYKWLRAFSVYDEWQQSSWSRRSPLPFYKKEASRICQDCHMSPVNVAKTGDADRYVPSHRFVGANTAIPTYYDYPIQLEAVRRFLSDKVGIDLFVITRRSGTRVTTVAPVGAQAFEVRPGDEVTVDLVVQNKGIGHSLVPEQRDFYESWVEFSAADQAGVFFHSGGLDAKGYLSPEAHSFTNRLIDREGKSLLKHQIWHTRLKTYDNTIMPGKSQLVRYQFQIPKNARGNIRIETRVNYRRFRKDYTDFVLGVPLDYPVFLLADSSYQLNVGQNRPVKADQDQLRQRWNNYGIALLGEQQWWRAQEAFAHTTVLDPSYVDGYVNQAIAEYSKWIENRKQITDGQGVLSLDNANAPPEKFETALAVLDKALQLNPNYARALYYKGSILRLQGRLDEAALAMREAVRQFPGFLPGREELGYIFYLQKNFSAAVNEFEEAKIINPDDVTACYYLSIGYAALGNVDRARLNAQLYSEHRDDPNNFALNLNFVKERPDQARELTPYHVHHGTESENH